MSNFSSKGRSGQEAHADNKNLTPIQARVAYTHQQIIDICTDVAPDGLVPIPILSIEDLNDLPPYLLEEREAQHLSLDESDIMEVAMVAGQFFEAGMAGAIEIEGMNSKFIILPRFDSFEGIQESFQRAIGMSVGLVFCRGAGFVDSAPHRVETSTLAMIRHEARHLLPVPRDPFEMEMICDGTSMLRRWGEVARGEAEQSLEDFLAQCEEHARYKFGLGGLSETNYWRFTPHMIRELLILSTESIENLDRNAIEEVAALAAKRVLTRENYQSSF